MALRTHYLSTISRAPCSYLVYSSLSFFGRTRGGELPGMWFVRALADAGREVGVVRQTLYRMEAEGELHTRKAGRMKYYRATRVGEAEIDAGLAKIFGQPQTEWDGEWTLVHVNLRNSAERIARERVVSLLGVQGFALLGSDVYVHPRDTGSALIRALDASTRSRIVVMRGRLMDNGGLPNILALWRVPELAKRYLRVRYQMERLRQTMESGLSDRDAFVLRFALVFDYLGVAWDDPGLPTAILPADWPGEATRALAAELYDQLMEPAIRHAGRHLQAVTSPRPSQRTS
jgi:phenylacetic acid degradation operon negative regulatory protein